MGEVCDAYNGGTPSKANASFWDGDIPWVSPKDMRVGVIHDTKDRISAEAVRESSTRIVPAGTILIVNRSGILARTVPIGLVGNELTFNQDIKALVAREEVIDSLFLLFALKRQEPYILLHGIKKGATVHSIRSGFLESLQIPMPPLAEQKRIVAILVDQMTAVERARAAAESRLEALQSLVESFLRESLSIQPTQPIVLRDGLSEIKSGVGKSWKQYQLLGVTKSGVGPAREIVGKRPEHYKLVTSGTIFYNPMRILIGSIGLIDEEDASGITSPDYVVFQTTKGILHYRWFYYWLRSRYGEHFIKGLARGAVRERMLFRRLVEAEVDMPGWEIQVAAAAKLKLVASAQVTIREQLDAISLLSQALLREAFSGELVAKKIAPAEIVLPKGIFFTRGTIAAYAVHQLHEHLTFGRVQLEKVLYLSESYVGIDLAGDYERAAAGPLDPQFFYKLEGFARKRGWFTVHRRRGSKGYYYRPGPAISDRLAAAEKLLKDRRDKMDHVLDAIGRMDTDQAEIFATVFAAWNDLLIDGRRPTDEQIIGEVKEKWHSSKKRIAREKLQMALQWMRRNGFVPRGIGPRTRMTHG